jgi:hypothetical protein
MKETWKRGSGIQKLDGKRYHSLPTQMFTVRHVSDQKREEHAREQPTEAIKRAARARRQ